MKLFIGLVLALTCASSFALCEREARSTAIQAVHLLKQNAPNQTCFKRGRLIDFDSRATYMARSQHTAEFSFPCGRSLDNPKVIVTTNIECEITAVRVVK